jgi:cytochrome P450
MILRSPSDWRRLGQLTGLAGDRLVAVRPGLWATGCPADIAAVLVAGPQHYHDRPAFVRVDDDRYLPAGDRHRLVRRTLAALHAHLPTDWAAEVRRFAGDRDKLVLPGAGAAFLASAYRDAIADRRAPELRAAVGEFVRLNLIRRSIQGRRRPGRGYRIREMRGPVGDLLRRAADDDRADLVSAVSAVPDLTAAQRGELYLRLVVAMLGATGVTLEWALIAAAGHGAVLDERSAAAVVAETLRLRPASWVIARQAEADHRLGGSEIRAGDVVLLLSYAAHRQPEVWPRPSSFDPSRWPPRTGLPAGAYVPFAAGPATCPGRSVALRTLAGATAAFSGLYGLRHRCTSGDQPYVRTLLSPPAGTLELRGRPGRW